MKEKNTDTGISLNTPEPPRKILILLFTVMAVASFAIRLIGIGNPIIEMFGFRQSQTAITVLYYLKEGLSLFHYQTPVLGSPWTLPFEFPIFQICAFFVYKFIHLFGVENLDIALRLTNIFFFSASAIYFYKVADHLFDDWLISWFALLIYLFSPFSIYWSRTSMIEYCAVFFGLAYIYFFIRFLRDPSWKNFLLGLMTGVGGYLAKSTSMIPACIFLAFYTLGFLWTGGYFSVQRLKEKTTWLYLACVTALAVLPVLPGLAWMLYSDWVKIASGYNGLTSVALHDWNFGSWVQKTSLSNWQTIISRMFDIIPLWLVAVSLILLPLLFSRRCDYWMVLALGAAAWGGVFVCFNLYYVHNYYMCAISPFLCLAAGVLTVKICRLIPWSVVRWMTTVIMVLLILGFANGSYYNKFLHATKEDIYNGSNGILYVADYLRKNTLEGDQLIIFDHDWDSTIPYYSQRKAYMVCQFNNSPLSQVAGDYRWVVCAKDKASSHLPEMSEIGALQFEGNISGWNVYNISATKYDNANMGSGATDRWLSNLEAVTNNPDGSINVSGWAVAPGLEISQVWLETEDGQLHPAVYGYERVDVADYFADKSCINSGFMAYIPKSISSGIHAIHVVYSDNGSQYISTRVNK